MVNVGFFLLLFAQQQFQVAFMLHFDIGNCDHVDLCCTICIGDLDVLARGVLW